MGLIKVTLWKSWDDENGQRRADYRTVKVYKTAEMRSLERRMKHQSFISSEALREKRRLWLELSALRSQEAVKHEASLGHVVEGWR